MALQRRTLPLKGSKKPNVVYFLVNNLGMGELSSYNGCSFRGATTERIDAFAEQGMMLFNFGCCIAGPSLQHGDKLQSSNARQKTIGCRTRRHET